MAWVTHHGRGYPFKKAGPAPMVRVRLRMHSDQDVLRHEPKPADWWTVWAWTRRPMPGDILEYEVVG